MYKTNYVGTESLWKIILQERQNFSSTPLESLFGLQHWVDRRQIDRRSADRFYFYKYMGVFQGKWRHLRPSGFEHACFPASPATLTSLLLPRSALLASMLWDGYSCSMKFLLPALPWLLISILQVSEFVWDSVPSKFLSALYHYQPVFFFLLSMHVTVLTMYWWMCLPPLDFKSHKGRVLAYLVCPSLWLNPIWSKVWALVCRAAFQVSPLLPHHCSQRWAGSLALTPGSSIYPSLVHPLSFSSLN